MKLKYWIGFGLLLGLVGCSSDDNEEVQDSQEINIDFTVIGEDVDKVYEYTYNSETKEGNTTNLTAELGIPTDYLTLRQRGDVLSFYSFSNGFFSLASKNVSTGQSKRYDNFYLNTPERSVAWGIDDDDSVFFGYFGPNGSSNLALQDFDLTNSLSEDVNIEFNVSTTFNPVLYNGNVYISYRDNLGNYSVTYYDSESRALGPSVGTNTTPFGFLISDSGELAVFRSQSQAVLELYDADDFSFLESVSLARNFGFPEGYISDAFLIGDRLYFNFNYAQPSQFPTGPAIYDLVTQELSLIDLSSLVGAVEAEVESGITLSTQVYDPSKKTFLLGYAILEDEIMGGVIVASENGELLANVTLPFFPTYFVRNN